MSYSEEELNAGTGIGDGAPRALVLDQLSLNGDGGITEVATGKYERKGGFYRVLKLKGAKQGEKPEEERLGENVDVVFLKVRRALQQRSTDGKVVLWTSEHNTPDDQVELRRAESSEVIVGTARSLREDYPQLRTIQYVYGLLMRPASEPELVKMKFKGAALGSDVKEPDVKTFYDYVSEERKGPDGKKEHLRHYITHLGVILEKGKQEYFTNTFERGDALTEEWRVLADETLGEVMDKLSAIDTARKSRIAALGEGITSVSEPTTEATIEYPEEEINPEDIPFDAV